MKKMITAAAAFMMLTATAAMANAADYIDPAGLTKVTIDAPAAAVEVREAATVAFDSNGMFTAAEVAANTTVSPAGKAAHDKSYCLDTYCRADMKL